MVDNESQFDFSEKGQMSQFVVHKDEVERVFNPRRIDLPPTGIHVPNLNDLRIAPRISLPSSPTDVLRDLPAKLINVVEGVEETIDTIAQVSVDLGREVAYLPHRASHEWKHLIWVLSLLVFVPLMVIGIVFFIPMNSVNDGIEGNRQFLYGVSTFYESLFLVAWVETFNFAQPKANISVMSRFIAWFLGILFALIIDVLVAEEYVGRSVFPIPFSILLCGMLSVLVIVVPTLFYLTPNLRKTGFGGMVKLIGVYTASLLIVTLWAVGINRLKHSPTIQTLFGCCYAPLRFICKILIASPVTTKYNPQRWIQLNLVVDMLFTRVQVATFPFIDSIVTLLFLFFTEVLTLTWRYYNGVDRFVLWWNMVQMRKATETKEKESFKISLTEILRANIVQVAEWHLRLKESSNNPKSILRTLTGVTDCESVVTEDGVIDGHPIPSIDDIETGKCQEKAPGSVMNIEAACGAADEQAATQNPAIGQEFACIDDTGLAEVESISSDEVSQSIHSTEGLDVEVIHRGLSVMTNSSTTSTQEEKYCEQRVLYHLIDSTGAMVVSIITRMSQQFCITMVRILPSSRHLNESFQITDERWSRAQIFGWTYIVLMMILLSRLGCLFFKRIEGFQEKKISLSRIMAYLYKDHFWFYFMWLLSTGALVCGAMVNHFGADFSLGFEWVSCPGKAAWPGCQS